MLDVQDKVVAITGAARGLGQEFAASLAAGGGRIVAGDINDCAETLDLVRKAGNDGVGVKLDVTDPGSARDMVEAATRNSPSAALRTAETSSSADAPFDTYPAAPASTALIIAASLRSADRKTTAVSGSLLRILSAACEPSPSGSR